MFWKVAFLVGVLTLAGCVMLALKAMAVVGGISLPSLLVVVFPLLAIETGVAGFLAFTSSWRFPPLTLTLLGLLMYAFLAVGLH